MRKTTTSQNRTGSTPFAFLRRRRPRSRGAALLEMCVSLIVMFYLVMGGVEFGWFMYVKHVVQSAARDGARQGIINSSTHAQAVGAVDQAMNAAGFTTGYTITWHEINASMTASPITDISQCDTGYGLRCTVTAPFSAFKVRPLGVIPATKAVTGVTLMVRE